MIDFSLGMPLVLVTGTRVFERGVHTVLLPLHSDPGKRCYCALCTIPLVHTMYRPFFGLDIDGGFCSVRRENYTGGMVLSVIMSLRPCRCCV